MIRSLGALLLGLAVAGCGAGQPPARGAAGARSAPDGALMLAGTAVAFDDASSASPPPFAVAAVDGSVALTLEGRRWVIPHAHAARIAALAWHGPLLASAGEDGRIRIWEVATGRLLRELPMAARNLAWNGSGRWLAAVGETGTRVYETQTGTLREILWGSDGAPTSLAWRADNATLAVGDDHGGLALFDTRTGSTLAALTNPDTSRAAPTREQLPFLRARAVQTVDWSADGSEVLTASANGQVRIWDAVHRALSRDVQMDSRRTDASALLCGTAPLLRDDAVLVRSRGGFVAEVREDGQVRVGQRAACATAVGSPSALAFTSGHDDPRTHDPRELGDPTYDPGDSGESPDEMNLDIGHPDAPPDLSGRGRINRLAWSPDGRLLAATLMNPLDTVAVWDTVQGEQILAATREQPTFDWSVAFSPEGRSLAVTSRESQVLVYDLARGEWTAPLGDGGKADGLGLAFGPGGMLASSATQGGIVVRGVNVWSLPAGAPATRVSIPACRTNELVWGRGAASSLVSVLCNEHPEVQVWSRSGRAPLRRVSEPWHQGAVGTSSDGQLLVACKVEAREVEPRKGASPRGGRVKPTTHTRLVCHIEETATGKPRPVVEIDADERPIDEVALNAQGDRLAIRHDDHRLSVWNLTSGTWLSLDQAREQSTQLSREAKQIAWSPDGRRLAASFYDKTLRVWDDGKLVFHAAL